MEKIVCYTFGKAEQENDKALRETMGGKVMNKKKYAFLCPIIFGVIFIIIGFCIQVPGGALTTYSSLDGHKVDGSHYKFSDKYSTIDEYVGGDAYNYEIGASLVAGRTAGAMVSKNIFIFGGLLCICCGITLFMFQNPDEIIAELRKIKVERTEKKPTEEISEIKIENIAENTKNAETIRMDADDSAD